MNDTNSSIVVVSGSSSGIGYATVKKYISEGFRVIGIDRDVLTGDVGYEQVKCDITDESDVLDAVERISSRCGRINYLVNCAGVFFLHERNRIEAMSVREWNDLMRNNLTGTMLVTKHLIPLLKKYIGDKAIVNISSDQVYYPRTKNCAYSVTKAGIEALSRASAVELLESGIRVNTVLPASVKSSFIRRMFSNELEMKSVFEKEDKRMPLGLIDPQDVAETIFFLGSPNSSKITGQSIMINSGLYI